MTKVRSIADKMKIPDVARTMSPRQIARLLHEHERMLGSAETQVIQLEAQVKKTREKLERLCIQNSNAKTDKVYNIAAINTLREFLPIHNVGDEEQ